MEQKRPRTSGHSSDEGSEVDGEGLSKYQKVTISEEEHNDGLVDIRNKLKQCIDIRSKWINMHPQDSTLESNLSLKEFSKHWPPYDPLAKVLPAYVAGLEYAFVSGVVQVPDTIVPHYKEFVRDYYQVRKAVYSGPVASYSHKRLELLAAKFKIHTLLNTEKEVAAQKTIPHKDLYNCCKVDTHVHHSGCMNQKHLLRFIKHKLKTCPDDVVARREGKDLTLAEVFQTFNLSASELSIDTMDMHAHDTYQRFDRFNQKFNPAGEGLLREIFLKTDNAMGGRYLAEITKEVLAELEENKYTLVEWRISIYGRSAAEWTALARWFYTHRLAHRNVRWMIQVPRLYHVYRASGQVSSFGQMMRNIFEPLFEATRNPSADPALFYLLECIVGFDSVDDESVPEVESLSETMPAPDDYTAPHNPPYAYWMYYTYANLCVLNQLRAEWGLSTFTFRPHSGEAGDVDHLISTYLLAHEINHGILLRKNPALQYLYYLSQVGIAMSPLCNSKLFIDCQKNPFPKYFRLGMNVSLSTDAPLLLHFTRDALVEEYALSSQMYKLNNVDLCEIARNSVLQSGFEAQYKRAFLGQDSADPRCCNVPTIRLSYRQDALAEELRPILQL